MRAMFNPLARAGNPYMDLLISNLERGGIEVVGEKRFVVWILPYWFRHRPDLIHFHWLWGITSDVSRSKAWLKLVIFLIQLKLLRLLGVGLVFTVHNLKPHESPYPEIDLLCTKKVIQYSNRVLVHGDSAKAILKEKLELADQDIDKMVTTLHGHYDGVYPNATNQRDARQKLGIDETDFVFLNLGTIRPYKGVINLIEDFVKIPDKDLRLVLAGRPLNEAFEKEIRDRIGEDNRVLFCPGFVAEAEIQTYIQASDVMVFPFRDILSSGSVILGLSFGRTCVAPDAGCISDILDPEEAFLYSFDDPQGLSGGLRRAMAARKDILSMGTRVRAKALGWSWEEMANLTLQAYKDSTSK